MQSSPNRNAKPCLDCGLTAYGLRCRSCRNAMAKPGPDRDKRRALQRRRDQRDRDAPGLTIVERRRMLRRWVKQGRPCVYCMQPAQTMDHVLPLARGGTNREGNLAPACWSCNRAKSNLLLVGWKFRTRQRGVVRISA